MITIAQEVFVPNAASPSQGVAADRMRDLRTIYEEGIEALLQRRKLHRAPEWTESLAVGNRAFVERVARCYEGRSKLAYSQASGISNAEAWVVREETAPYSAVLASESTAKIP